jgi:hypothetical protein
MSLFSGKFNPFIPTAALYYLCAGFKKPVDHAGRIAERNF